MLVIENCTTYLHVRQPVLTFLCFAFGTGEGPGSPLEKAILPMILLGMRGGWGG